MAAYRRRKTYTKGKTTVKPRQKTRKTRGGVNSAETMAEKDIRAIRETKVTPTAAEPPVPPSISTLTPPPATEEKGELPKGNTVTVKIYPNNTPGSSELTLGDYRVKINKTLPGDITTVEHFLTNTMKYIKSHVDKYKNRVAEPETSIFPNTKFKYIFVPSTKKE